MLTNHRRMALQAVAALLLPVAAPAGDLDPPGGPVLPTMKTLDQVEPRIPVGPDTTPGDSNSTFQIDADGSYYLTGDVTGEPAKSGITINADNVTIDLRGFQIIGVTGSLNGVNTQGARDNIRITNGVVRDWEAHGIITSGSSHHFDNLKVQNNGSDGMNVGQSSIVRACTGADNAGYGIRLNTRSVIENCTTYGNGSDGILANAQSVIRACTAYGNGDDGIDASQYCTSQDSTASFNTDDGFDSSSCTISGCSADTNTGHGFNLQNSAISGSSAQSNSGNGIHAMAECVVSTCTALTNFGHGISALQYTTVTDCVASGNFADGINLAAHSTSDGCNTTDNQNGISVQSNCRVSASSCDNNDDAGILVSGSGNSIENNNVTLNDRGIDVDTNLNAILRNTAALNTTDFDIVAGNAFGPIINISGTGDISGDTATSHPWANFSY